MRDDQAAQETKGVTVNLLAALDLGPEIQGMAGRELRMRMFTIEPGGVIGPIHDHIDRPGMVYILQGTITDHRNGVAKEYGPELAGPKTGTLPTGLRIGKSAGGGDLRRHCEGQLRAGHPCCGDANPVRVGETRATGKRFNRLMPCYAASSTPADYHVAPAA